MDFCRMLFCQHIPSTIILIHCMFVDIIPFVFTLNNQLKIQQCFETLAGGFKKKEIDLIKYVQGLSLLVAKKKLFNMNAQIVILFVYHSLPLSHDISFVYLRNLSYISKHIVCYFCWYPSDQIKKERLILFSINIFLFMFVDEWHNYLFFFSFIICSLNHWV